MRILLVLSLSKDEPEGRQTFASWFEKAHMSGFHGCGSGRKAHDSQQNCSELRSEEPREPVAEEIAKGARCPTDAHYFED